MRKITCSSLFLVCCCFTQQIQGEDLSLHQTHIRKLRVQLSSSDEKLRSAAAEKLGFLRAYEAADELSKAMGDSSVDARRNACLSLGWCGGREQLPVLLKALDDSDWSVRQAAWVALTNLTGMEFPFASHAAEKQRRQQAEVWRTWYRNLPDAGVAPSQLSGLLQSLSPDLAQNCSVSASSTYKGPPTVLTDGSAAFWQTKQVDFPQHCTVDLGSLKSISSVSVEQYGKGFCMTDCGLSVSTDGIEFRELFRQKALTPPKLTVDFKQTDARFVRITSYASERPIYPTTFFSLSVFEKRQESAPVLSFLARERTLRALGSLGGKGAAEAVRGTLTPYVSRTVGKEEEKLMVQAAIRATGRLNSAKGQELLIALLQNPQWARYAADALGDIGGEASAEALIAVYPHYAMSIVRKSPAKIPKDDKPGFEPIDRMYETAYVITLALSRFPLRSEEIRAKLLRIAPLLPVNMASDFDGAMIYDWQAFQEICIYLLDRAGLRKEICEIAFQALGFDSSPTFHFSLPEQTRSQLLAQAKQSPGGSSFAATWMSALCRDRSQLPRLIKCLQHDNGWVRINAAKTLMFMKEKSAVSRIEALLKNSKTEADYGYFGDFLFKNGGKYGQDEYKAPSPCWREAFTRALGELGSAEQVPLLIGMLTDDRNVLEVQYSAALSLDKIGNPTAIAALKTAAAHHPFHSIRLLAREALWKRNLQWDNSLPASVRDNRAASAAPPTGAEPEALVFIKGSNDMPNDFQIDIWRQTYSTTDSGPTYRLGENLYLLKPVGPTGKVSALTTFTEGYVADCELSWNGERAVFARRGKTNPWWHVYELEIKTRRLRQLTKGPYHDVQPAYLPDGRIVFSSSRVGLRDEYHGYPATGLTVMNRDGSGMHCIGFNLGRDNEPAIMPDGGIVFSRLDLFYSRLKTEITVQTTRPDGTMNQTVYGPERREFWRNITQQSGERGWGEVPSRHRVLRLTQPQGLQNGTVMVATTGGATIVGPNRMSERVLPRHQDMAVTSPFPLDGKRALCAATRRAKSRKDVDLGLYLMDLATGGLDLIYNDPKRADFEARPVMRRARPPVLPQMVRSNSFTARLMCSSARTSQEELTRTRGKLLRIIEGQPVTGRHHTHTNSSGEAWKNHTGTHARVLGTVPLASDGSFFVEIPADRLVHCQVLDSDRRVVGNQLVWMYARPGETRSCVGCHETPDTTTSRISLPVSAKFTPLKCLPTGDAFSYRAKAWQKGHLRSETEERTRTVNAINLPGRM